MTQVWWVFYLAATAIALSAADGGTVEGTVVNSVTGEKLAGVAVEMTTGGEGSLKVRTVTGTDGEFRFLHVDAGEHSISYEKDDFGQSESEPSEETVRVTTQGTALVRKKLDPLTTLEGKVLDDQSRGVRRITVDLLTGRGQARRSVFTDDAGAFRIGGLPPGVYLLRATPNRPAWQTPIRTYADIMLPAEAASLEKRVLQAPYYYPGVPAIEAAAPIRINGEKWLLGCDIRLPKRDIFAIRGKLVDPAGDPVPDTTVKLKSADTSYIPNGTPPDAQISTDGEGRFEFPTVMPGRWHLVVASDYGKPRAFQSVVLTRADLEDVTLRLALPFALEVSVEGLAAADSEEQGPRVQLIPVDGPLEQETVSGRPKNGQIRMEHMYPGRYRFYESRRAGYYLDAILLGDRDVLGQEVELMAGAPPIRMVYKSDGGKVHGTVADGGAATVVLVPEQSSPDHWHSALSDEQGHFEIGDLRPGNYFAIAVRLSGALQDPQFLALVEHDGTLVHVNAGEIAVADLRAATWPR